MLLRGSLRRLAAELILCEDLLRMKLLLVNPPIARYDTAELAPPLGLLTLASSAVDRGLDAEILDLNLPQHRAAGDDPEAFYDYAVSLVARAQPDEVGISSMGVNSHVAIHLAETIARKLALPVVLGGHHLATIADLAERITPAGVRVITPEKRRSLEAKGEWWANAPREIPREVDRLFSRISLQPYLSSNSRRVANLESGRGCKYRCSFCYSPSAYSGWTTHPPDSVVESFHALSKLGFRHAFLVDDNLTNSTDGLMRLCQSLGSGGRPLTWNGYATLPDLHPSVFPSLADAGCVNLYLGVDAVEPGQQRLWRKRFLRNSRLLFELLAAGSASGIVLTCAFILDPDPSAKRATESTLEAALAFRRAGADIRLSVLTVYPKSELASIDRSHMARYSEARTAILMDLPKAVVVNPLAHAHPAAFPWHTANLPEPEWSSFLLAVHAAQTLINDGDAELPKAGADLWSLCHQVGARVNSLDGVHKTQLRGYVRRFYQDNSPLAA